MPEKLTTPFEAESVVVPFSVELEALPLQLVRCEESDTEAEALISIVELLTRLSYKSLT